jgi:hypothetical protein
MKEFIRDFYKRVSEIDKYFSLVDRLEHISIVAQESSILNSNDYTVDRDIQKILKSQALLGLRGIMYNKIRI